MATYSIYFSAIFGGGACPSTESRFPSKHAQAGALFVQIFMVGEIDEGSSKVPIRTTVYCGLADELANRCEPHAGQKRRRIWFPLSATLTNSLNAPFMVSESVFTMAFTVPLEAMCWQSLHQQTRAAIGSPEK
ncbi:hypothetical protein J2X05_004250 [Cellvibrio fibrivorans]|jgi:hypothetical protein|uniref:Uncharacterized protein n=1 Tax=Cellvibrio fibrivorans TaxID=126350 RepID=A0ABU1V464_9GAMM|nr:hypothetical protein [Cellvibrio fibrivorans]MDR7092209.1 hypothetical protein [Cellvibrio fibrivorans]